MEIQVRDDAPLEMRREENLLTKIFKYLFCLQLLLIIILELYLTVRGVVADSSDANHFHPKKWYTPVLSSVICAGIIGFAWQFFTSFNPSGAFKAAFFISPLVTCAFGILLVSIGSHGSAAAAVFVLAASVFQSLYGCWVRPRFHHASRILAVSIAYHPPRIKVAVFLSIVVCILYSTLVMSGIGGATATGTKLDSLFIFLSLLSFLWTLQVARNMMFVTVAYIKFMRFASGTEAEFRTVIRDTAKYSMGNVCIGSILVPILAVIRGLARAISLVSGDVDEFLFSCADCCSGVAKTLVACGNRWGFVQVGVYRKGIVQASKDTWEMFTRIGIENLINTDLTSSFCFLSGTAAGSICALVTGTWALLVHKSYATEVSLYTFLTGYLVNRVTMAWIQSSVAAYYVAYAENPQNQQFDGTIPDYSQALQRLHG